MPPRADSEDPLETFHAEGTVPSAKVTTKVNRGLENGPYVDYHESNGSSITSREYRHTLDIDKNGWVIRGKWDVGTCSSSSSPTREFRWAPRGEVTPEGATIEVVDCGL